LNKKNSGKSRKRVTESPNQRPSPLRSGHFIFGMIIVVAAAVSMTIVQRRANVTRVNADSLLTLTLSQADAYEQSPVADETARRHRDLATAVTSVSRGSRVATAVTAADVAFRAAPGGPSYTIALRDLVRAIGAESRISAVRTQQIQMGIVAGTAIALILILMSVAVTRGAEVRPRRARAHTPQIDPLTGLGKIDTVRALLDDLLNTKMPGTGFVGLLAVGIQPEHENFLPLTRAQLDAALAESARRLRRTVRATDTVGRFGRDELAVVLPPSARVEDPGRVAGKILKALDSPMDVGGGKVRPNPRVGIAIAPIDAATADGLIERARVARRAASDSPAAVYRSYTADLAPRELGPLRLLEDLRTALAAQDGQLWVAYQPKIDLRSEKVVGFEALARWDHPSLGHIAPSEFIRAAEESDLILDIGAWVLDQVCSQIAAWAKSTVESVPISVNVSSRQFEGEGLLPLVRATLARHNVPAHLLELELTEGILLEDRLDLINMMNALRDLGVKIALDDFGTGYSALGYLKRFPIDVLKIDRTFIREIDDEGDDEAISTAIISLAHSLALQVVAEGVETPEQLGVLRDLGCDAAQGFYFAHPAPATEIIHRAVI